MGFVAAPVEGAIAKTNVAIAKTVVTRGIINYLLLWVGWESAIYFGRGDRALLYLLFPCKGQIDQLLMQTPCILLKLILRMQSFQGCLPF
jgi:hypothetical protein